MEILKMLVLANMLVWKDLFTAAVVAALTALMLVVHLCGAVVVGAVALTQVLRVLVAHHLLAVLVVLAVRA
jgi:hypothetical protein